MCSAAFVIGDFDLCVWLYWSEQSNLNQRLDSVCVGLVVLATKFEPWSVGIGHFLRLPSPAPKSSAIRVMNEPGAESLEGKLNHILGSLLINLLQCTVSFH
jgi:hypothetical protein